MPTLDLLPDELLLVVFAQLADSAATLRALCLTSRHVNRAATSILYRAIGLQLYGPRVGLVELLRTLLEHPRLAQAVKSFSFDSMCDGSALTHPAKQTTDYVEVLERIKDVLSKKMPTFPGFFFHVIEEIAARTHDRGLFAILIFLLGDVRFLNLKARCRRNEPPPTNRNVILDIFGEEVAKSVGEDLSPLKGCVSSLRALLIDVGSFELVSIFTLPNLTTLIIDLTWGERKGYRLGTSNYEFTPAGVLPRLRKLYLKIHVIELEPDRLGPRPSHGLVPPILSALNAKSTPDTTQHKIEVLKVVLLPRRIAHRVVQYSLCTIMSSLLPMKSTLTHLSVFWPVASPLSRTTWHLSPFVTQIASMSQFECLHKLELPQDLLVDRAFRRPPHPQIDLTHILPRSIQKLVISFPDGMLIPWVHQLHEQLGSFPRFRRLHLYCMPQHGRSLSWFEKRNPPIADKLRAAGVAVEAMDIGQHPWRPSDPSVKTVDIFDHCEKCVDGTCVCIQHLFCDLEFDTRDDHCGSVECPTLVEG